MQHLNKLPKHLLSMGGIAAVSTRINSAVARHFRKHVSLPLKKWNNPTKYVGSVAKQLNGRLSVLKGIGKGATWYVPATLGLISTVTAPEGMKMRTLFKEGFGVVGGALGTLAGAAFVLSTLCLGPVGMFVAVFICASAGGIIGSKVFKAGANGLYDSFVPQLNTGQIYHSPEQFFWEAVQ
jgi:hypothetical protein